MLRKGTQTKSQYQSCLMRHNGRCEIKVYVCSRRLVLGSREPPRKAAALVLTRANPVLVHIHRAPRIPLKRTTSSAISRRCLHPTTRKPHTLTKPRPISSLTHLLRPFAAFLIQRIQKSPPPCQRRKRLIQISDHQGPSR